jgi:hypothetical protein
VRRSFLVGLVAVAVLGPSGAAAAGWWADHRAGDIARGPTRTTVVGDLSVSVARAQKRVVAERDTTYLIQVTNRGKTSATVTLRAMVPPWLEVASRHGGQPGQGYVDWPAPLPPGETVTARLTGRYAPPGGQVPGRAAFTVCAFDADGADPVACATDFAQIRGSFWATWWWLVTGLAAAAAVALGVRVRRWRRAGDRRWQGPTAPATAAAG